MNEIKKYFDYASSTPLDPKVLDAMTPYFTDKFYNPSAIYAPARENKKILDDVRSKVAQIIGVQKNEIVFTSSATEANNLAIAGIMDNFDGANLIFSAIEHASVSEPAKKHPYKICPVDQAGMLNIAKLSQLINDNTVLISVIYANNEIGTIQNFRKINEVIKQVRDDRQNRGVNRPIYLHTDASQAVNYLDVNVGRLGVDMMSVNSGKIYGPKGCGFLYASSKIRFEPIIYGGGQERNIRSGTENIASIVGLEVALELAQSSKKAESQRLAEVRSHFIQQLEKQGLSFQINGSAKNALPNIVSLTLPGVDNERLVMAMDELGYCIAVGSACHASNDLPSEVLGAVGLDKKQINSTIRISFGRYTDSRAVDGLVKALKNCIHA